MSRRRPTVPQRRLAFIGCEGLSERAYVALLNNIAKQRGIAIWLHAEELNPGAGDPLALVQRAIERRLRKVRGGVRYAVAAILLDSDRCATAAQRCAEARAVAATNGFLLVWQDPKHEAMLLRHLPGCDQLHPPAERALPELKKRWPEYAKEGITAHKLEQRITFPTIERACKVEPELAKLLRLCGFL